MLKIKNIDWQTAARLRILIHYCDWWGGLNASLSYIIFAWSSTLKTGDIHERASALSGWLRLIDLPRERVKFAVRYGKSINYWQIICAGALCSNSPTHEIGEIKCKISVSCICRQIWCQCKLCAQTHTCTLNAIMDAFLSIQSCLYTNMCAYLCLYLFYINYLYFYK